MKNKARRKEASSRSSGGGGGGGGIVIEAANRKARRKEERNAKKKKLPQQHQPSSSNVQRNVNTSSPANKKKKLDIQQQQQQSNKRVKFSNVVQEQTIPSVKNHIPTGLKKSSLKQQSTTNTSSSSKHRSSFSYYDNLDAETAAALRKDDMEIEYLESNLGIKSNSNRKAKDRDGSNSTSSKNKNKELNREYAKNEGFGDDFGDFLMGLDDLVERCVVGGDDGRRGSSGSSSDSGGDSEDEDDNSASDSGDNSDDSASVDPHDKIGIGESASASEEDKDEDSDEGDEPLENVDNDDAYAHLDEDTALALRNDDAEIAALEEKLGLSGSSKARKKLNKEFASTFMGYGEDFGDFLDELDLLSDKVGITRRGDENDSMQSDNSVNSANRDDESNSDDSDSEDDTLEDTADHDESLTYRPTSGEDIYGNMIDTSQSGGAKPTKYIPPHLRNKDATAITNGTLNDNAKHTTQPIAADPETVLLIQRQINNALNRLSEQTLESVSKSVASIYSKYPSRDVNDCLWKNIQMACVSPHMVMSGLIPLYVGAISGVHWLGGDGILLGGSLVEWSVTELFNSLEKGRGTTEEDEDSESIDKEATNMLLIVCYLYNYGVIHCSLIYDLVRDFIRNFTEIDVEALLIILSHCGPQLRSDDPSALKEIILLVKDRAQKIAEADSNNENGGGADSSRVEFLVDSIIELRNNKPRKQDIVLREKTNALKKSIGRIKSSASRLLAGKKSGSCLRLTLRDVLDADTKGRWWMVGASWAGNQNKDILFGDPDADGPDQECDADKVSSSKSEADEEGLLALASSQRMNTDARRAIFCIIMGSSDFDDAFEKLVRQGMLKPKVERDVIRVIVHCCGEEEAFNPFYAYLAIRCSEYQPKSRFTLMLTFWDIFKQLETFPERKVANLAKLLAHLVGSNDKCLNIGVLKRIEFSPTSMPEMQARRM
ncbi:hypothetical protein ACHAXH_005981 [Discostella pseudostelligera]